MPMKKIFLLSGVLSLCLTVVAQPKWAKKTEKAMATLYAIQQQGDTISAPTFYIDEQGTAFCALHPLQNARQAWIQGNDGKTRLVSRIQGFDATYNIARVSTSGKGKTSFLPLATQKLTKGETVYLAPKGMEDKIVEQEKANEYAYYTLSQTADAALAGYPLMSAEGQVAGILQTPIQAHGAPFFALDVQLPQSLKITAIDANASCLRNCHLLKQLPTDESQARSFLYLAHAPAEILAAYAEDFIRQFPTSPTGYIQSAKNSIAQKDYTKATQTFNEALKSKASPNDEIYFSRAEAIYNYVLTGDTLQKDWNLQHARQDIEQAIAINPLPLYTHLLARIQFSQQDYASARNNFIRLTETNMREPNLFLFAAQCMEREGQADSLILSLNDSAVACFTRPYTAEAANALWLRSVRLRQMGKYRDAVRDMNDYEHLMRGRLSDEFYYQRFQAEFAGRMFAQALEDINKAIELKPDAPLFHAQQAALLYRTNQTDQAIASCKRTVQLDAQFADAYRIWGICLRDKGEIVQAREQLKKAVELGDTMAQGILDAMK